MSTKEKTFSMHSLAVAMAMCALTILGISSIALFLAPNGSMARLTGWTFLGLTKDSWEALSTWFGFMAVLSGLSYLYINRQQVIGFFTTGGKKFSREAGIAVVISAIIGAGSIGDVGPFSALMRLHEVKKYGQTVHASTGIHSGSGQQDGHSNSHGGCASGHEDGHSKSHSGCACGHKDGHSDSHSKCACGHEDGHSKSHNECACGDGSCRQSADEEKDPSVKTSVQESP